MQINDCMFNALRSQGFIGGLTQMLLDYYRFYGATSYERNTAEWQFLLNQGATPANINGMWYEFLGNRGYTGAYPKRRLDFWCDGGTLEPTIRITSPTELMYDDTPVSVWMGPGTTEPLTIDMNTLGVQAWTNHDPAINYIQGTGKVGFVEYEGVQIDAEAQLEP